jgi:hypothetical protein
VAVGLAAGSYLLLSNSMKQPQAIGLVVATGLGLLCVAGETGAKDAGLTGVWAAITQLNPFSVPACRERDLHRGQAVIVTDLLHGKQQYRFKADENDLRSCNPKNS